MNNKKRRKLIKGTALTLALIVTFSSLSPIVYANGSNLPSNTEDTGNQPTSPANKVENNSSIDLYENFVFEVQGTKLKDGLYKDAKVVWDFENISPKDTSDTSRVKTVSLQIGDETVDTLKGEKVLDKGAEVAPTIKVVLENEDATFVTNISSSLEQVRVLKDLELTHSLNAQVKSYKENDKLFVDKNPVITFSHNLNDDEVTSLELYKGSEKVRDLQKDVEETIEVDGTSVYTVKAVDLSGTEVVKSLSELLGSDANLPIEVKSIDLEAQIDVKNIVKEVDSKIYIRTSDVSINYTANSDVVKAVYTLSEGVEHTLNDGKNRVVLEQGENLITVRLTDKFGNVKEVTKTVVFDNEAPVLSIESSTEFGTREDGVWEIHSKGTLTGKIKVEDTLGLGTIQVLNERDEVISDTVDFSITETGTYSIKVTDSLGNEGTYNLGSLLAKLDRGFSIVIDTTSTSISIDSPAPVFTKGGVKWYTDSVVVTPNIELNNLRVAEVLANGRSLDKQVIFVTRQPKEVTITEEGTTEIKVKTGKWNFTDDEATQLIGLDKSNPVIQVQTNGVLSNNGGKSFVKDVTEVTINVTDAHSGIKEGSLQVSKNGVDWTPVVDNKVEINESGQWVLKVSDNVGHEEVINIANALTNGESSEFVYDNSNPVINTSLKVTNSTDFNGNKWYNEDQEVSFEIIEDDVLEVVILVDGSQVVKQDTISVNPLTISKEGLTKIDISVTDKAGNSSTKSLQFGIDKTSPDLTATTSNEYGVQGTVSHFKDDVKVKLAHSDATTQVNTESIEVSKDNTKWVKVGNEFSITEDGSWIIRISDVLGNKRVLNLAELITNGTTNSLIIDKVSPELQLSPVNSPNVLKGVNWFSSDVELQVSLVETNLKELKVIIDNVEFQSVNSLGSLKQILIQEEGSHEVVVRATDYAGNTSETSYSLSIDKSAPNKLTASSNSTVVNKPYGVLSSDTIQVSLTDGDNLSGHAGFKLNNEKVSGTLVFNENTSGNKLVSSYDNLDNETSPVSLSSLLGWLSDNLIVDREAPTANLSEKFDNKWYSEHQSWSISLKDNEAIESVVVKVNEKEVIKEILSETSQEREWNRVLNTKDFETLTGSYKIDVIVTDVVGHTAQIIDTVRIDITKPDITQFEFVSNGVKEGKELNGGDGYGFYFENGAVVRIHAKDDGFSSGLDSISYRLTGGDWVTKSVSNGYIDVELSPQFKGSVEAYATDNVGNISDRNKPSKVLVGTSNYVLSNTLLNITLPDTPYKDNNGLPLYNSNVSVSVNGKNEFSGFRTATVGNLSLGSGLEIVGTDSNLRTSFSGTLVESENRNNIEHALTVTDMIGISKEVSTKFSIDKDAPIINVSFNATNGLNIYNSNRIATITIDERNFNPSDVKISGQLGTIGAWSHEGNVWTSTITFDNDGIYNFSVAYTDLAGNAGSTFNSEEFTIDKTNPVLNVSYNLNDAVNGKYYNKDRVATLSVTERNFDPSLVVVQGGTLGGWSSNGDVHTSQVTFKEGVNTLTVSLSDKAGNNGNSYSGEEFIIDTIAPELSVIGILDGSSYRKDVSADVKYSDVNIDNVKTTVTLVGRSRGNVDLNSSNGLYSFFNSANDGSWDDYYTLRANIVDLAGNIVTKELSFHINRGGSAFSFADLGTSNKGTVTNNPTDVVIQEVTVEEIDESSIRITLRDGKVITFPNDKLNVTKVINEDGKWLYTYTLDKGLFQEEGTYRVELFTKTKSGQSNASIAQEYVFTVDKTAPEIIVGGIETNGRYFVPVKEVSIDIRDLSGYDVVEVLVNGKPVEVTFNEGVAYFKLNSSNETQNIDIRVVDKAGNESKISVNNVLVNQSWWGTFIREHLQTILISLVLLIALILGIFLILRRRKEEEEAKNLEEIGERVGSGSSSVSSSTNDTDETGLID